MAYSTLTSDEFSTGEDKLKEYKSKCHKRFPYASVFRSELPPTNAAITEAVNV